jgi:hypothetical protein
MKRDAVQHTAGCMECLRFNVGQRQGHPVRHITATYPLQHISMDCFSMPVSSDNFSHCLVVGDMATRFVWLYVLRNELATELALALIQFCSTFGFHPLSKAVMVQHL